MSDGPQTPQIPVSINEEDSLLQLGPINLSLRQMIMMAAGILLWFLVASMISFLGQTLAFILTSPMLAVGFAFAFIRRNGRPLDAYLGDVVAFKIEPREYLLRESSRPRAPRLEDIYE